MARWWFNQVGNGLGQNALDAFFGAVTPFQPLNFRREYSIAKLLEWTLNCTTKPKKQAKCLFQFKPRKTISVGIVNDKNKAPLPPHVEAPPLITYLSRISNLFKTQNLKSNVCDNAGEKIISLVVNAMRTKIVSESFLRQEICMERSI
ncbi:hypothetical protein GQ457_14G000140 [Hibiscus cannabinus]